MLTASVAFERARDHEDPEVELDDGVCDGASVRFRDVLCSWKTDCRELLHGSGLPSRICGGVFI